MSRLIAFGRRLVKKFVTVVCCLWSRGAVPILFGFLRNLFRVLLSLGAVSPSLASVCPVSRFSNTMRVSRRIFGIGSSYPRSDSRYSIFLLHYSLRSLHCVPSRRLTHPHPKKRTRHAGFSNQTASYHLEQPRNKGCLTHQRPRSKILFAETIPTTSLDAQERPDQTEKYVFQSRKSMLNPGPPGSSILYREKQRSFHRDSDALRSGEFV